MIAMAFAAYVLQFAGSFAGHSRVSSAKNAKFNFLVGGVERGKAFLKQRMDNKDSPPKYTDKTGVNEDTMITGIDVLMIKDGVAVDDRLGASELGKLGIWAKSGRLVVRIYDMQYKPSKVAATDIAKFPPSLILVAGDSSGNVGEVKDPDEYTAAVSGGGVSNSGVYLIRASLEIDGAVTYLDTAVVQSNMS
jgi:hypothetical protein